LDFRPKEYCLATVHRQENTDDGERLCDIIGALDEISRQYCPVILPMHPRTRKALQKRHLTTESLSNIVFIDPVDYIDMICLQVNADVILTDSGGVQKEAYFAGVPCVTLREETEWVETVDAGVNVLCGTDQREIITAYSNAGRTKVRLRDGLYGNGKAGTAIIQSLIENSAD
jgi:UDP-GlcNAc3NAcA epimerase